jgi:hypothetical protein
MGEPRVLLRHYALTPLSHRRRFLRALMRRPSCLIKIILANSRLLFYEDDTSK